MPRRTAPALSRRERQIMDAIYQLGSATAREVHASITDPPSYSAVRALLSVLETKGHLRHVEDGPRYLFLPTVSRDKASVTALQQLVQTFFEGSATATVAALINSQDDPLSADELKSLSALITAARREGR